MDGRPAWEQAALGRPATTPAADPQSLRKPVPRGGAFLPPPARPSMAAPAKPGAPGAEFGALVTTRVVSTGGERKPVMRTHAPEALDASVAGPQPDLPRLAMEQTWLGVDTITARHEDTMVDLAVQHDMGFTEIAMANPGVDPWLPGDGTTIVLPSRHLLPDAPHKGIVINLPEQRLYLFERDQFVVSFPIGIGRDGFATPIGRTRIVRKQAAPVWYPTPSARRDDPTLPAAVAPGPDNPLGTHALYLGWPSYLIHGTNKEYGIGRRASRGCIRMYANDIVFIFNRVPVGTSVTVVDQPIKIQRLADGIYLEADPSLAQVQQWEKAGRFKPQPAAGIAEALRRSAAPGGEDVDWTVVDRVIAERRGIPTRVTRIVGATTVVAVQPAEQRHTTDTSNGANDLVRWLRAQLFGQDD
ncbi:MAG: L,D-transpeptidase family protein [Rhodospirillales bacterium]|nr:L,D-transpeptidase family protein [Rhodospirillales bacterium]